jgi:hypothetical protein
VKTTPEENKAIMEETIAYFGTYTVDEAAETISLRVEASTFPYQIGSEQTLRHVAVGPVGVGRAEYEVRVPRSSAAHGAGCLARRSAAASTL